jgi:hypothetical protein
MLNGNSAHGNSNSQGLGGGSSNSIYDMEGPGSLPPGWWLYPVVVWRWS